MKNVFRFLFLMCLLHTAINSLHAQWSQTSGPLQASVNELLYSGTTLFAGTNRGVYRSSDDGASWTQVNNGFAGDTMIVALAISGTTLFAGDWVNGVFRSTDNGANWTQVNSGMSDTYISDLLVVGSTLFAGTGDGGKMFRSQNDGTNWEQITNGLSFYDGTTLTASGGNIYLGDNECVIFHSTNNGSNWTQISTGVTGAYISSLVVSGSNLFAGSGRGVFLSTNNGTNWTQINNGLTDTSVSTLVLSGTDFFAGTQGGVFHSTNNGANWTQVNGGLIDTNINALAFSGIHLFAGTDTSGVFRGLLSALPVELTTFVATAKQNGVELHWRTATEVNNYGFEIEKSRILNSEARSQKSEEVWNKVGFIEGNGTTNAPKEYSFSDENLSAGNYSYRLKQIDRDGKFEYSQSVEVTIGQTPKEFELSQNYPNPFNPFTVISYQLPVKSHVSLKVYDAIGREVSALVNEMKDAGSYAIQFDASKLSGGVYFYTLRSGNNIQTKKLLLLK